MKQTFKEINNNNKPKIIHKKSHNDKENEPTPSSDIPVLSDSLLRRIQNKHTLPSQNISLVPNVPTLPSLPRQSSNLDLKSNLSSLKSPLISNSLKLKTSTANIALSNSINNLNQKINSARFLANRSASQQSHLKKLNKTKFSAFNNFQLNELTSSSSSFNSSGSNENSLQLDDLFENGSFNKEKFNEKFHGSSTQSNLLRKLKMNDNENQRTEIFVRPIPVKTKSNEDRQNQSKHKVQPININLAPLIKNFRLNSFDFQKFNSTNKNNEVFMQIPTNNIEFNIESSAKPKTFEFNFKPIKPVISKSSSPILANFEITAHPNNSLKPIDQNLLHNKSINYLANGLFDANNANNSVPNIFAFKSSSYASLNRKLDLDDIEYYDFNELFRNNSNFNYWKADNQRKKLSQINEESTVSNTPMSDSRWSSSLSTNSDDLQKMEEANSLSEQVKEELWSANNSSTSAHTSNTNQYGRPVRRNSRPMLSNPVF